MPHHAAYPLFFRSNRQGELEPRVQVSGFDAPAVMVSASLTRRRIERATDVLTEMTACASSGREPPWSLRFAAIRVIGDLSYMAKTIDDLEQALQERERSALGARDESELIIRAPASRHRRSPP